jgi:hypothetical protein
MLFHWYSFIKIQLLWIIFYLNAYFGDYSVVFCNFRLLRTRFMSKRLRKPIKKGKISRIKYKILSQSAKHSITKQIGAQART